MHRHGNDLANHIADVVIGPELLREAKENHMDAASALAEASRQIALQLESPSGRQFIVEAVACRFDSYSIDEEEFDNIVDAIYGLGPVAGFPLGQTVRTHGFMCTGFAEAELDTDEIDALGEAVREILAESFSGEELDGYVREALDSRICDISCFDAAGFINRRRETNLEWKRTGFKPIIA